MDRSSFLQVLSIGGAGLGVHKMGLNDTSMGSGKDLEQSDINIPHWLKRPSKNLEKEIYILSNFHPASCGWLDTFSAERNYCCNSYLTHLDRVDQDPNYKFVLSEVNNMIAIKNFRPARFKDLKKRIQEGRVGATNANFVECTINLSGGEALVRQGVEGLRWQQDVLDVRPRFIWMIDICGMHRQMAQITDGLGLDGAFYCRNNPTQSTMEWLVSPDGSYTIGITSGGYASWRSIYKTESPLTDKQLQTLEEQVTSRLRYAGHRELTPDESPYLVLGGSGDYSLAPKYKKYPTEFIKHWKKQYPKQTVYFSIPENYFDQVYPKIKNRNINLPVVKGGWPYKFKAFWIENPQVKQRFRTSEHLLQTTEALVTAKSIEKESNYPSQEFYHAWLQLLLNMDRNTLWGSAAGMVFESQTSWDASDRFNWIDNHMEALKDSFNDTSRQEITLFNGCNWNRNEPMVIDLPKGKSLNGIDCQRLENGKVLCIPEIQSFSEKKYKIRNGQSEPKKRSLPDVIETEFYKAKISPKTGDLISVRLRSSGKELLGGPANRIIAEVPDEKNYTFGDFMVDRDKRHEVKVSSPRKTNIEVYKGPVATIVKVRSKFLNNQPMERTIRFYQNHRRIDFETNLHNVPNRKVISAEFPFSSKVISIRRGIPYGYAEGSWDNYNPSMPATVSGITPVIRWSEYSLQNQTRVALLDRGLTGREYDGNNCLIFLMCTTNKYHGYKNSWLSGEGDHHFEYALFAHEEDEDNSIIQKQAYSYNSPILKYRHQKDQKGTSFLQTSQNVIVQALRREDNFIELRMVEVKGKQDEVSVKLKLPHQQAYLTNMVGDIKQELEAIDETYHIMAKPQQIITMRFKMKNAVKKIKPLTDWTPLVPKRKRANLNKYRKGLVGHPPFGN